MATYDFDCGCKFPVTNEKLKEIDGLPSIKIDYDNLNFKCPKAWLLFTKGYTKGIFQLETNLGQSWAKKVQPVTIEEVAALTAILRPGMLKGILDGKSMTQHFVDRKNGTESFDYFHPDAEPILSETYGTMTYQEQIISIAKIFGGFNLQQADTLRKAMGKKKADVMAKCRDEFVAGCNIKRIISEEDAIALFDIIQKSNRYSFNKSHAVSYGLTAYMCAIPKAHFPLHFFTAWLSFANGKMKPREEIADLIQETKNFKISVENPNISHKNENFLIDNGKIRYGLASIKSCGLSEVEKLITNLNAAEARLGKKLHDMEWHDVLIHVLSDTRKDVVNNLVHAGALSQFGMTRSEMLFQYNKLSELNDKEVDWIKTNAHNDNLITDIEELISAPRKTVAKRREKLGNLLISIKNPSYELKDSNDVVAKCEEDVLGISISCSKLDSRNTGFVNCTCAEFTSGVKTQKVIVPIQITRVTEWCPKDSDKPLCFLTGYDKTGKIDIMVPSDLYKEYSFLLFHGNTVAIHGSANKRGNLTAKEIIQL